MKKFFLLSFLAGILAFQAKSQCVIDSTDYYLGAQPVDSFFPPIIQGVPFDSSIQIYIPGIVEYLSDTAYVYWTTIDTIEGFPTGITYYKNPAADTIQAFGRICIEISGTTTDATGEYHLNFIGHIHIYSAFSGDTIITLHKMDSFLQTLGTNTQGFSYFVTVINPPPPPPACNIDSPGLASPGVSPVASDLPCIIQSVPYNETLQGRIQSSGVINVGINLNVIVDSVRIDSLAGLPGNITWAVNPPVLQGGGSGCINFSGTTTDTTGTYALTAYGTVWFADTTTGQTGQYPYTGNLNQFSPFGGYYLRVVGAGDSCIVSAGINHYNSSLNAMVDVFPNPGSGVFEVRINAASPVTGKLLVFDALGRTIYEQPIDVLGAYTLPLDLSRYNSGLYTYQLSTTDGYASGKIALCK